MDVIYEKYRGLVLVMMLYEYIESGRCDSFTRPYGAYNKYDQALVANMIISRLDQIIYSLDDIKNN